MNLNKNTKAELISKINGLNSKQVELLNSKTTNYSNNLTFFQAILKTILYFKSIILKITFIAFLIKMIKKYSILRRLWTLANYSLMSIFGISIVDIYGIDYLNSMLTYIRETNIYTWFSGLLGNKNVEIPSRLNKPDKTTAGIEKDSTIAERFKQIINKKEEILIEEDTPFYKDKNTYIKGAVILLLLGLGWYYWEDLQPIPGIVFEKLNSFRRRPGSDPGNTSDDLQPHSSWNIKDKIKGWWNRGKVDKDQPVNPVNPWTRWTTPSQSNTPIALDSPTRNNILEDPNQKNIIDQFTDPGELSQMEANRRLIANISGDRAIKFDQEASIVLGQITHFLDKGDNFPDNDLKLGMYNTIRGRLLALSSLTPILYENLIKDNSINNEIERFLNLENQINPVDNQSDTYQEVALATVEEQEVWSDRGSSPRVLSPKQETIQEISNTDKPKTGFASLFDSINKLRNDTDVVEAVKDDSSDSEVYKFSVSNADRDQTNSIQTNSGLNLLTNLIQEANNFDDSELLTAVRETFDEKVDNTINSPQPEVETPQIQINEGSNSDNSMDEYFPNPEKSPQDSKLSPILSQININTNEFIEGSSKDRPAFLNAIKSMRKEYGTPIVETKTLFKKDNSSMDNILEDTNRLLETDLESAGEDSPTQLAEEIINPWPKVQINRGQVHERFLTINHKDLDWEHSKILIMTNDGRSQFFDPHFSDDNHIQTIKWDNLGVTNPDSKDLDITNVWFIDKLGKSQRLYENQGAKIFRQKFLDTNITTLTKKLDSIIRLAYIGGSTDYYYKYGENLKHYDVNSLYPKAMCNPMPIDFLGESDGTNVKLKNIFGFAEAKITAPKNIEIPLLPFKLFNETIHPIGSWIGIYFTEELKAVEKYGYKIELIKVYNFSKANIFENYIKYFYNIKKSATGALRLIAKMHLNQLYGYFGRKKTLIETKNVYKKDLNHFYGNYTIFSEISINENISTILMSSNLDYDLINEIKRDTGLDLMYNFKNIKSHVGIAAAVTAYARIEMLELKVLLGKLNIKLFYTDTDSIFVDKELPNYLIGNELGLMKDELKGGYILKAYFFGNKKYAYLDETNATHSVFSGIERNTLTWNEIIQIAQGSTITKPSPARFFKNLSNLNIQIKNDLIISVIFKPSKKLLNNKYLTPQINIKFLISLDYYLKILKTKIIHLINKYNIGQKLR